jgi:membrane protease YdiL (CAAX protease family)
MRVELLILIYSATTIFAGSACLMALGCALWGSPVPLLPPRRNRMLSWTGLEVLVAFAALVLLLPLVVELSLQSTGLFQWLYDFTGGHFQADFGEDPDKGFRRVAIWEAFLGFPLKLLVLWVVLKASGFFHPYQLGFTTHRLWQMVALGWFVWIVSGLPCDLIHLLLNQGYSLLFPHEQEVHAIIQIAQEHPTAIEWLLLVFSAVLIAPFMEELLFRGLLLRWLANRPGGVTVTLSITLALAFLTRASKIDAAWQAPSLPGLLNAFAPVLFVAVVWLAIQSLSYLGIDSRTCVRWRAILASSLLFGIAHANVWPTPVALFAFAICLAWVASRTQSIVPCIVAHSLFNAVACVELGLGLVRDQLPYCSS